MRQSRAVSYSFPLQSAGGSLEPATREADSKLLGLWPGEAGHRWSKGLQVPPLSHPVKVGPEGRLRGK